MRFAAPAIVAHVRGLPADRARASGAARSLVALLAALAAAVASDPSVTASPGSTRAAAGASSSAAAPRTAATPADGAELPAAEDRAIDDLVESFRRANGVPGMSVSVVAGGRLAYCKGFGSIALSGDRPADCDTRYRIASVSKAFTAVALLQLQEKGALDLDEPARRHCPAFHARPVEPTLRQVLAHQGGLRHTTDREDTTITGPFDRASEAIHLIDGEDLEAAPGSRAIYSSWGYVLLGCAIEGASGLPYMDDLERRVLAPAGLTRTGRDSPDAGGPDFSPGFRMEKRSPRPSQVVDTRFKTPASGLISTASDLGRFALALEEGVLLAPATLQTMIARQTTQDGSSTPFALGWTVGRSEPYGPAVYQAGQMEGATALLYLVPGRRYAVAILENRERFAQKTAPLLPAIGRIVLDGKIPR